MPSNRDFTKTTTERHLTKGQRAEQWLRACVIISLKTSLPSSAALGNFSKPRRRHRQERKGLMSKTMVLCLCFESWYISNPLSAKKQREMTKF